jgi:hypothetical protein
VGIWHISSHADLQQRPARHMRLPLHLTSPPHDWPASAPGAAAHTASAQAVPAGHITVELTHVPVALHFFEVSEPEPAHELPQSVPSWRGWHPLPFWRQAPVKHGPLHDEAMQQMLLMQARPDAQSEL